MSRLLDILRSAALILALVPAAVASSSQDLTALFAPPTQAELDAVRADWASRTPSVQGYRLEATGTDAQGIAYHVVSHVVDSQRHFAAIKFPRNYVPGGSYGALVVCHGGLVGVAAEEAANFLFVLPGLCVEDEYFLIIPSYRGESLRTSFAGDFLSGGTPNYADRDVDDVYALLSAALVHYQDIDHARIGSWGISRGGAVALLLAARDDRIRLTVDMFGFTDLSLPSVQAELDLILNQGVTPTGIGRVAYESVVRPWINGVISFDRARLEWLKRSPCYFVDTMPRLQAHHGLQDTQIDPSHTIALLDALTLAGVPPQVSEGFFYPNGTHGLSSLTGHGEEVEPFMCSLQVGPRSYCGPMTPHAGGLYSAADYRGTDSITNNDLVFRANNCPRNSLGLVFIANSQAYAPSGAGFLCVGLGASRLGVAAADASGTFNLPVDFGTTNPELTPFFNPGQRIYLQLVFRDSGNPAGLWNFSNGLEVDLRP